MDTLGCLISDSIKFVDNVGVILVEMEVVYWFAICVATE